jgi:2-haloacid dehalogenase
MLDENGFNKPKLILLDVYETVLDMSDLERKVNELLASKRGYRIWFESLMEYCFVDNCIQQFHDFGTIAKATMQMTAEELDRTVSDEDVESILGLMKQLPVHQGVQQGLSDLYDMGIRMAALTNTSQKILRERMEFTGMISFFEDVLSAEQVKKYKPCIEVYTWAARRLNVAPADVLMVSAHGWDLAGAFNAGMKTAYLQKERTALFPLSPKPNIICSGLDDLANKLAVPVM